MATMTRGHRKQATAAGGTPSTPSAESNFSLQEVLMDIKKDLGGLKATMDDMSNQLKENKEQLKSIGEQVGCALDNIAKMDKRVLNLESQEKKFEAELLKQEMDSASHILRIQNVIQLPEENLQEVAAEILASVLNVPSQDIVKEFDYVFRLHNLFTKRANQPPELVVKLFRRYFRDSVLSSPGVADVTYKGSSLKILREIPWKIRQNRRQYKFFTRILRDRGTEFRWLVPEGVQIQWEGKWIRIESITKLQKFIKANVEKLGLVDKLGKVEEEIRKLLGEQRNEK